MTRKIGDAARILVGPLLLGWAAAEVVEAVASWMLTSGRGGAVTVVVPGFRNQNPTRANAVNRWRARAAVRTARRHGPATRILACGGDPAYSGVAEADLLAAEIRRLGFDGEVILERESRTTTDNARCVAPMISGAELVAVASNPLHGLKLRLLLGRAEPSLRTRFVPANDYRAGELGPFRVVTAAIGLGDLLRAGRR